jgi:integrase
MGLVEEIAEAVAQRLGVSSPQVGKPSISVGQLYLRFKATRPKGRAWQMVRALLRPFILRHWRAPCSEITALTWLDHAAKRRKERTRNRRPPKEATLNLELQRAKQLFAFGEEAGLLTENPLRKCKPVKTKSARETWLTEQQFERLVAHAGVLGEEREVVFRALVIAMVVTGMRISEALRVRRDRIHLDGSMVLGSAETKTRKARVVGFTNRALVAMSEVPGYPGSPYVFASKHNKGKPYDASAPRHWLRKVAEASGLDAVVAHGDDRLRLHDLRHSAASIAEARGAMPREVQAMLGHTKISTTERYLHREKVNAAAAIAKLMDWDRVGPKKAPEEKVGVDSLLNLSTPKAQIQ